MQRLIFLILLLPILAFSQTRFYTNLGFTSTFVDTVKFDFYVWEVIISNDGTNPTDSLYFWTELNPTMNRKFVLLPGETIQLRFTQSIDKLYLQSNTTVRRRVLGKP